MRFTNRSKIILFLLIVVLNILLRFASHERGTDSTEMHILANSISEFGEARWIENPLGIIGMFPLSYAAMISFFLSGISQISGFDIETSIFIYSIIFGIFSIFTSYTLAGIFYDNDLFKYLVSFGFSLSPGVVEYTTWTANARSPFIIILPLFLYALFKCSKNSLKFIFLCVVFLILLYTTHHMAFYLIPILIGFLIVKLIYYLNITKYIYSDQLKNLLPWITISAFLLLFSWAFLSNKFLTSSSRWHDLALMTNEYPRYAGILFLLSIGGLIYLIFKANKRQEEWLLLISLVMITPFLLQERYTKWFILIFWSVLSGVGFINLNRLRKVNIKYINIIVIFLILSVTLSGFLQYLHIRKNDPEINDNEYITSIWVRNFTDGNFISNHRWNGWVIQAISGSHFLSGSTTADNAYGFVTIEEFTYKKRSMSDEAYWLDSPYLKINGTVSDGYWQIIMERGLDVNWNKNLLERFNITWLLRDEKIKNNWFSHHGSENSPFVDQISKKKNRVYDSGLYDVWALK